MLGFSEKKKRTHVEKPLQGHAGLPTQLLGLTVRYLDRDVDGVDFTLAGDLNIVVSVFDFPSLCIVRLMVNFSALVQARPKWRAKNISTNQRSHR